MSVEATTSALAATSLNDAAGDKTSKPKEEVLLSAAEGRRLYIGNLAYATTEEGLKEFFKGFTIESTSIPINPRTNRPVGYAFVDLTSASDAERAIADLSGKEILERKVSVQLARKPTEGGEKGEAAASGGEGGSGGEGRRRGSGRGRGRGRGRGGRGGRTTRDGAPLPLTDTTNDNNASAETGEGAKPRGPRVQKQRGPPEDGIPSKTKIMVANLPYDLGEEKLKEMFNEYQPSAAKVALRPIPRYMIKKLEERNENRKGRGFGFVTLASEELQQKAITEMNGKQIDGREIAVKVAIDSPGKEDDVQATAAATEAVNGQS